MFDIHPAVAALSHVVRGISDDQLCDPTPCQDVSVGDLLDHVDGLSAAFAAAAVKAPLEGTPSADGSRLGRDWRERIPSRLEALATAWEAPQAWTGMTAAGGVELPGEVAASVALDEVIVHTWDLAVATGQQCEFAPELVEAARSFVAPAVKQSPDGTPGLFGRPVPVAADASPLDQLLGLTGRDPAWHPR